MFFKGKPPCDGRGRHQNRPRRVPQEAIDKIKEHIGSLKGQKSHYSINNTRRIYLPEDLNIPKMYGLFTARYPKVQVKISTYRAVFNDHFNVGFGYPRADTCSQCDEFKASERSLNAKLSGMTEGQDKTETLEELNKITTANTVHKKRADVFYQHKRACRAKAQKQPTHGAICMDYQKQLPVPNVTTNDVYYSRQLSCITFNIHELGTGRSYFFCIR